MTGVTFDARKDKLERTRTIGTHMREARARLTGVSGGVSYEYELLNLFVSSQIKTAVALPVLAVVVAGYFVNWAPISIVVMWLSGVAVTQGVQLILCRQFRKQNPVDIRVDDWGRKIAASEFLMAASWASLSYVAWGSLDVYGQIFVICVLYIVAAIRMSIASSYIKIVYAGIVPITFAIALQAAIEHSAIHTAMTVFAISANLYALQLARNLHNTAQTMLSYRAQKDALIEELEQAKANSDRALRRAEQASAAKSHFLATMSHELRTPLNAILGFSEILKDEVMGGHAVPAYKEYANDIHRSGEHLLNLINQVLDHSRVEAGRFEMHETPVALEAIAADCRSLLSLKARDAEIEVIEIYENDLPNVKADERAIRQIWLNLIANAIKFTPPGGKIVLTVCKASGGGVAMSVRDTGPGIPAEEIPRVLSSFGQGSLSYETAQEGAGLGLPIVRGLVELHSGSFELKSAIGIGTEAVAEFPRSRVLHFFQGQEELPDAAAG
ncbi:MAG: sensor histidine kinase [Hyphomicrobiales bacterium]